MSLTEEDIEELYLNGWFMRETPFGTQFDYHAFAAAVIRLEDEKRKELQHNERS